MQLGKDLIDSASNVCGGDAALARRLKISKSLLSMMRAGERAVTPAIAAEMADISGQDAREAIVTAVIEGEKKAERRAMLLEILGKGLAAGGAALLASSYSNGVKTVTTNSADSLTKSKQAIHRIYSKLRQKLKGSMGDFPGGNRALAFG